MKISRLFEMVFLLMNHKKMSAKELAKYFEVSVRTIYRDIDVLSMANIPIYATKGRNGGIALMDHYVLNKALVSKEEQQQILTSLKSFSFSAESEINQTLKKLKAFFDVEDTSWLSVDYKSWSMQKDDDIEFSLFKEAILQTKQVRFLYYDKEGRAQERIIEPYQLLFKSSNWYVHAYCVTANDFRYFKINRMQNITLLDRTFTKRATPEHTFKDYISKQQEVIIKVDKKQAHRVLDEMKNDILKEDKNYFLVKLTMDENWIYSYLFGYLDMIEVIEPQTVRIKMKEIAEKINNKY